jgi:N-acetylneuraminic acid mutarotase
MDWKKISCYGQQPKTRRRTSVCTYQNKLYIYGGFSTFPLQTFLSDFLEFDPLISKWTRISTNSSPSGRSGHTIVTYKNSLFLFGGASTFFKDHNEIWEYNFLIKEWKELKPKNIGLPFPRQFHSSCLYHDEMIIYGGYYSREIALNDLFLYSIVNNEWRDIPREDQIGIPPEPITDHVIFSDQYHLYVFGGAIGNETVRNSPHNVYCFNFITSTWKIVNSEEKPTHPIRMSCLAGVAIKDKFFVFGGYDDDNDICSDDFHSFDMITHEWSQIETKTKPEKRLKHSISSIGDEIYVFGGMSENSQNLNDLYVIKLNLTRKNLQSDLFSTLKENNFIDVIIQ